VKHWLALALLALVACDPPPQPDPDIVLYAQSAPPPARAAKITNQKPAHTVTLSEGAVLAAACWDSCDGSCIAPELNVSDPSVLGVRSVYRVAGSATELALIGTRAGSAELTVRTKCAERTYAVLVEP
jgi:hypothetical protein